MASKAAGANLGVASKSHLVVLKAKPSNADNIWAFQQAKDDIIAKGRRGKAVVEFARGARIVYPGIEDATPWREIKPILQSMFPEDIVVVTSSGNSGELPRHENVDSPPKIWSADNYPLIVVGAVDNQGKVAINPGKDKTFSQGGPKVTVWAPGKDVTCAAHNQNGNKLDTGTSPASAMTAGLVAYFLSLREHPPFPVGGGNTAGNARNHLRNIARWIRPGGRDPAIWNGIDSLEGATNAAPTKPNPPTSPPAPELPSCTNTKRKGLHVDYHIEINHMTGNVIKDGGSRLFKEQSGCGILNSWNWKWTKDDKTEAMVTFNQPWGMKGGCVERAFMTAAGGPKIAKCSQK